MLEKSMYDFMGMCIRIFIKGRIHVRMMLIQSTLRVHWSSQTVEEDGQTRPKKYPELIKAQQLQDVCFPPSNNSTENVFHPRNQETHSRWKCHKCNKFKETKLNVLLVLVTKEFLQSSKGNYCNCQAKVVKCYNCLGEGHMAKQCTQPKRPRNSAWFKEKLMLVEAQEAGQILDEEQLAFIADPGIAEVQVAQQTIPQNSAFQTKDLDAYDSDCDYISSAKAVLMANLSSCDSDVLSEVPYSDTYLNDMINQDVQEMSYSEQTHIVDFPDNEITNDSNIIPYSQYLQES
ncbi:retrovirus-related pol polyprotein from transposon TNT 1-94 [Tanacetum coccineum]